MKRVWVYLLILAALAAAGLVPIRGHDVAELLPVQVLVVRRSGTAVELECDGGVRGRGATLELAMTDLSRTAPGTLFLDTAEHIVLADGAWDLAQQVVTCGAFRPAARLYLGQGELPQAGELTAFFRAHPGQQTLCRLMAADLRKEPAAVPRLIASDGRVHLAQ